MTARDNSYFQTQGINYFWFVEYQTSQRYKNEKGSLFSLKKKELEKFVWGNLRKLF